MINRKNAPKENTAEPVAAKTPAPERKEDPIAREARRTIDEIAARRVKAIEGRAESFRRKTGALLKMSEEAPFEQRETAAEAVQTGEYRAPELVRAAEKAVLEQRNRRQDGTNRREKRTADRLRESRMQLLQRLSDECAEELPKEFFEKLTGGVCLTERSKTHPESDPSRPLMILGEYRNDRNMGRSIMLYGGSILRVYGHLGEKELKDELRRIIRHEFTHHIESLSGERGLEIYDEVRLENYKEANAVKNGRDADKK